MEQFQLLCQVRQSLSPVAFRATNAFMSCHVLDLPDIVLVKEFLDAFLSKYNIQQQIAS